MVDSICAFNALGPIKVLVIGDFMIDLYTKGEVERVSPEAPVPVLHVKEEERLPGGAGNVAMNLAALGAEVQVLGRVGEDAEGKRLRQFFQERNIDASGLLSQHGCPTTVKNRLLSGSQQLLRIDLEEVTTIDEALEREAIDFLSKASVDIIAISDYNKGFLSDTLLEKIFQMAKVPVIVDPKGTQFAKYRGATLIKPNLKEAYAAAHLTGCSNLDDIAAQLLYVTEAEHLLITRSGDGMSLFTAGSRLDFPVKVKEVNDVTGAGDTALAMITFALANGMALPSCIHLANIAASLSIERIGCAPITLSEVAERYLEYDTESKIFDEEHFSALKQLLKDQPYNLLPIDPTLPILDLVESIQRAYADEPNQKIILTLEDEDVDPRLLSLLSSMTQVSYILLQQYAKIK